MKTIILNHKKMKLVKRKWTSEELERLKELILQYKPKKVDWNACAIELNRSPKAIQHKSYEL